MSGAHKEMRLSFRQWLRSRRYLTVLVRDARQEGYTVTPYTRERLKRTARAMARRVDE